jgi:short-subunit dehydrogenase
MKALITWASSWLGAEFAKQLAQKWYDLILVARNIDNLKEVGQNISKDYWVKTEIFSIDLWTIEWIKEVCDKIIDKEDIDLLINNAWRWNLNWYLTSTFDDIQSMLTLNMSTIALLSQRIVNKWIEENKNWKIINVASIASFLFDWTFALYSATKAFVRSISYGIDSAIEDAWFTHKIKVQCLCPWLTKTNFMWPEFSMEYLSKLWFMESKDVVKESLNALETGEFLVIPWPQNKVSVDYYKSVDPFEERKWTKDFVKRTGLHF